jgi:hypothetical protein
MSGWQLVTDPARSYLHYFSLPRARPPRDDTATDTISATHQGESLGQTKTLHRFDASQLRLQLEDAVVLDLNLVRDALSKYGPILDSLVAQVDWTWDQTPSDIAPAVTDETGFYSYLQWIIFRTAARALPAVLHCLSEKSSGSLKFPKVSSTANESQRSFGSTDIIHYSLKEPTTDFKKKKIDTLHEVKRARVLGGDGNDV